MISFLALSHLKEELSNIRHYTIDIGAYLSDDEWRFFGFSDIVSLGDFLSKNPVIDISCIDVTMEKGVATAENIRNKSTNTFLILIADASISPMTYIKPTVMASSLLIRPFSDDIIKEVLRDVISEYLKKFHSDTKTGNFVIDNRGGRQLIPYEQILFFESRDKKIFLNTGGEEYAFYDTLDRIEESLNDSFIRCHRSFIVSKSYIKKIILSQNTVILKNGYQIPLSRTYKSVLKELK